MHPIIVSKIQEIIAMSKDAELEKSYKKQVIDALDSSKEIIQILKVLSNYPFTAEDVSRCFKEELSMVSEEINTLVMELKSCCNKALALSENATSLNNAKTNIKKFDDSFERFKSISHQAEKR